MSEKERVRVEWIERLGKEGEPGLLEAPVGKLEPSVRFEDVFTWSGEPVSVRSTWRDHLHGYGLFITFLVVAIGLFDAFSRPDI